MVLGFLASSRLYYKPDGVHGISAFICFSNVEPLISYLMQAEVRDS